MCTHVSATPFHVRKLASHDADAPSLPFVDAFAAAREEDDAVIDDYPSTGGPEP